MADATLKRKIRDLLRTGYFKDEDDYVYVTDGDWDDYIHILVVSPKFVDQHMGEKSDLIWSELVGGLPPEEWGKVTLSIGVSPEELMVL
ncbi:MAG: hypothetical protein ABI353_02000 [Isosphaeraceae bacterium]